MDENKINDIVFLLDQEYAGFKEQLKNELIASADGSTSGNLDNASKMLFENVSEWVHIIYKNLTENLYEESEISFLDDIRQRLLTSVDKKKETLSEKVKETSKTVVESYSNIKMFCELYSECLKPLGEKIVKVEGVIRQTLEKYPAGQVGSDIVISSAEKAQTVLKNCETKISDINEAKLWNERQVEEVKREMRAASEAIDRVGNGICNAIKEAEKAKEEERRRLEEEARKKREEAVWPFIKKICDGWQRVEVENRYSTDGEIVCVHVSGGQLLAEKVQPKWQGMAAVPLFRIVDMLESLPKGCSVNLLGMLKTQNIVTQDADSVLVVDTGHGLSTDFEKAAALNANISLCDSYDVFFTVDAFDRLKNLK